MRRVLLGLGLLVASAAAWAQEEEGGGLSRVVVLPTSGNCAKPQKAHMESAAAAAARALDTARFQLTDMNVVSAEIMSLGEDDTTCKSDACWLGLLTRLGISFALRSECMDVGGTAYVTVRVFNAKSGGVMGEDDFQADNAASLGAAEGRFRGLLAKVLDVRLDVPVAALEEEGPARVPGGPKVAVFVCESPLGFAYSPDHANTSGTARLVSRWLRAHKFSDVETPATFRVPASSLGRECDLDSFRAKELAAKTGAATVVWLRSKDRVVKGKDSAGREVQGYEAIMTARAYHAGFGRYGRLITVGSGFCEGAVLASHGCKDAYAKGVDAVMAEWAESLKANSEKF